MMAISSELHTKSSSRHSGGRRNPGELNDYKHLWTPAFAGVTI